MLDNLREQLGRPHSSILRQTSALELLRQTSESSELSSVVDSSDLVAMEMGIEELGMEPAVHVRTIGDLLGLLKAIEFQRSRKKKAFS